MRISDWSSDVCSSDLRHLRVLRIELQYPVGMEGIAGAIGRMIAQRIRRETADQGTHLVGLLHREGRMRHQVLHTVERIRQHREDRKSVVSGKSVSGRVNVGGCRIIKKKKQKKK